MPILGWFLGSRISVYIESVDHWIAFGLLSFVGIRMIHESLKKNPNGEEFDPSKGSNLILLSIATSIDAFAIGLSLAVLNVSILYPSIIIGIVTGILSVIGIQLGNKLGIKFGKRMEVIGGVILILIGIKILIEHLS
jgi:putative Mn2+ efflux pump MntP